MGGENQTSSSPSKSRLIAPLTSGKQVGLGAKPSR